MNGTIAVALILAAFALLGLWAFRNACKREDSERSRRRGERKAAERHARIVALFERMVAADWGSERYDNCDLSIAWCRAETVIDFEDQMREKGGAK